MSDGQSEGGSLSRVIGPRAVTLYLCFFVSGLAGLIYEVLWAKYLALYVGSTGLAQVIVLATFMGGMALGSHVLGRRADRVRNPLHFYVYLEFGIGVYALFFDRIFTLGRWLFIESARLLGLSTWALTVGKIGACVLTILLPTFLMGGTLPALGRFMIRHMKQVGPRIARLYFVNSFGAVFGCLLAGFYLIRTYGLQFSMVAGGCLNILVGLVGFAVFGGRAAPGGEQAAAAAGETPAAGRMPAWVFAVILTAVSLSGAVSMMYEVAWIRLLTLVLGSSTYSFSLMLATFILGLSTGGFLLSLRKRAGGYTVIFGGCEVAVGLTILLALPFYVRLPFWFNQVAASLSREPETFALYQFAKFFLCALVMFIPTVFQGITLPAATKVLMRDVRALGRRVGYIFAINTLGTLAGATFAGFIGLPWLGIKGVLDLAVALNCLIGLAVLATTRAPARRRTALIVALAAIAAVGTWYALRMGPWDRQVLCAGAYRTRQRIPSHASLQKEAAKRDLLFYRDGIDATIAVADIREPRSERLLIINGKVDASTVGDLATQKMMAHLPLLLHRRPERVLIVGVGSGATIGSVLAYDVKEVDVVELSRDVIDAARLFDGVNGRYWEDPRVTVHWEDAKTFLQVTGKRYDLIISEPTNPWIAGVAGVFSREYFEQCRQRLSPDGFFVQWIQVYDLEDATFFMMQETFTTVFPYYTLWNPCAPDTVLVGATRSYEPDFAQMEELLAGEAVRADLATLGVDNLLSILCMQMADLASRDQHVSWLGAVHSDFFPVLEYIAPRGFFIGSRAEGAKWIDHRFEAPANAELWIQDYLAGHEPTSAEMASCYRYILRYGHLFDRHHRIWAREWLRRFPDDPEARLAAGAGAGEAHAEALALLDRIGEEEGIGLDAAKLRCELRFRDYEAVRGYLGLERADALAAKIGRLLAAHPDVTDPDSHFRLGALQYDLGRYAEAAGNLAASAGLLRAEGGPKERLVDAALLLCQSLMKLNDPKAADAAYRGFLAPFEGELKVRLTRARIDKALADGGV